YQQDRAAIPTLDKKAQELINAEPARDDLETTLKEAFDFEIRDEAMARVQLQVTERDWGIFCKLTFDRRVAREVAQELGMKVPAVLMVKGKVMKKLRQQIQHLEHGEEIQAKDKP